MTFKEFLKRIADKWFCLHEWELQRRVRIFERSYDKLPSSFLEHFICKKCGKNKKINL